MARKPKNFLNNSDLFGETLKSQEDGRMTEKLGKMLLILANRYGNKYQFCSYTYLDDMKSNALITLVKAYKSFNKDKTSNAFAYYTQITHNAFLQYLNKEKKQRNIRDKLLIANDQSPSYAFSESEKDKANTDKEAEFFNTNEEYEAPQVVTPENTQTN